MRTQDLHNLERILTFKVNNVGLFKKAFTHKTYAFQKGKIDESNERLEFLGDSVLNLYISRRLYDIFAGASEGMLTRMRSYLVNTKRLARIAKELRLDSFLKIGDSFEGDVSLQTSVLADTFEALTGAIFLDGGWKKIAKFIENYFQIEQASDRLDSKSRLQQIVQKKFGFLPRYEVVSEEGLPHKKKFIVNVRINEKNAGTGTGSNKKIAEEAAALSAITAYEE
ncbi:MAG: ribonuclease III [bacterium]